MASGGFSTMDLDHGISARPERGAMLREGMFFTIEPMIKCGRYDVKISATG